MKVKTRNSVYSVSVRDNKFVVKKIEDRYSAGEHTIRVGEEYVGVALSISLSQPMILDYGDGRCLHTSTVLGIEN